MAKFNAASYAKNVAKSTGYISGNILKGLNPTMTSFVQSNASSIKEMYDNVKDFKHNSKSKFADFKDSEYGKFVTEIGKNAIDDLKTGKWYNKDRENRVMDDYMKSQGFSFDDDMDAGFNWEETEDDTGNKQSDPVTSTTVTQVGNQIAIVSAQATTKGASHVAKTTRWSTQAIVNNNIQLAGMLNTSLAAVNTSIMNLHQDLVKPLNDHIVNSTKFYTTATDQLAKQTAFLENINRILTERYEPKKSKSGGFGSSSKKNYWRDFRSDDLPTLATLMDIAKGKVKDQSSDLSILSSMMGMFSPDMIGAMKSMDFYHSPIAALLTMTGNAAFNRSSWGKGFQRTNKVLRNAGGTLLYRAQKKYKNDLGPLGFLANLFDIFPKPTKKFNTANYEKGRVDWTGMDAKALREVIPTQLAKIASALTGEEPMIFNYTTGRWESMKTKATNFEKSRKAAISSSISNFKSDMVDIYKNQHGLSSLSKAANSFGNDLENLMNALAIYDIKIVDLQSPKDVGRLRQVLKSKGLLGISNDKKRYMIDERHFNQAMKILLNDKSTRLGFTPAVLDARSAAQDFSNRSMEDTGYNVIRNGSGLYRNKKYGRSSIGNTLLNAVDDKGNNIFFYLQSYYSELKRISHVIEMGGGAKGYSNKRRNTRRGFSSTYQNQFEVPVNEKFERDKEPFTPIGYSEYIDPSNKEEKEVKKEGLEEWWDKSSKNGIIKTIKDIFTADDKKRTIFDKFNDQLANLIYGEDKGKSIVEQFKEKGLTGVIKDLEQNVVKGIHDLIDETKNAWNLIKTGFDKFFNETKVGNWIKGKWEKFTGTDGFKRYTGSLKSAGRWVKGSFSDTYRNVKSGFAATMGSRGKVNTSGNNSDGGQVLKSGIVSVSEGEMIVPAEENPFYNGPVNKSHERAIEGLNKRAWLSSSDNDEDDFWGSFRKGKKNIQKPKNKRNSKKRYKNKSATFKAAETAYNTGKKVAKGAAKAGRKEAKSIKEDISYHFGQFRSEHEFADEVFTDIENVGNLIFNKVKSATDSIFGTDEFQSAKSGADRIWKEVKPFLPETLAGGTIGSVIGSAITGSPVGLLAGFVIGSGVSLVHNSDNISRTLFGDKNEIGEYQGGLLNKNISNFIAKRLPKAAKSGVVGSVINAAIGGPGGLLGGFILGAGLDLVSTTTGFKNLMFGHEGADGKRRGGIVGSLQTRVVDPLADYVNKGIKNLDDYLKKNFLDPIGRLFNPLADWAKGVLGKAADFLKGAVNENVVKPLAEKFDTIFGPFTKMVGGVAKRGLKLAGSVVSLPFKAAGAVGDRLKYHNIRQGYSSLSPEERMALEGTKAGKFGRSLKNSQYTKFASLATEQELRDLQYFANGERENRQMVANMRQDLSDTLSATLESGGMGDRKTTKELRNIINSDAFKAGDSSGVESWIDAQVKANKMTEENASKARTLLKTRMEEINAKNLDRDKFLEAKSSFEKEHKTTVEKLLGKTGKRQLDRDIAGFDKIKREEERKKREEEQAKKNKENLINQQLEENPVEEKKIGILETIKNAASGIWQHVTGGKGEPTEKDVKAGPDIAGINNENKNPKAKKEKRETKVVIDDSGNPIQLVKDANGDWVKNVKDSGTKAVMDKEEEDRELRNGFYRTMTEKGGFLERLSGLFGFNSKDEKEEKLSLWDRIKGFGGGLLRGVGGFFKGIFNVLKFIGKGVTMLGPVVALLGGAVSLFKSWENWKDEGLGSVLEHGFDAADSAEAAIGGFKRTYYDEDEWQEDYTVKRTFKSTAANALAGRKVPGLAGKIINPAAGALRKVPKAIGGGIKKVSLKSATKLIEGGNTKLAGHLYNIADKGVVGAATSSLADAGKNIAQSAGKKVTKLAESNKIVGMIKKAIDAAIGLVTKFIGGKGAKEAAEQVAGQVAEEIGQNVVKKAGSSLAKNALKAAGKWAFVILAAENGFEDAQANIGLLEPPTIGERFLSAAAEAVSEVIFGLIPPDTLINILIPIATALGFDMSDLQAKRNAAMAEWQQYEQTEAPVTGKSYNTLKEYLKNTYNLKTTQDRVKEVGGKIWGGVKTVGKGILNAGSKVVGGIAKATVGAVKGVGTTVATAGKNLIGGIAGTAKAGAGLIGNVGKLGIKAGGAALNFINPFSKTGALQTTYRLFTNPKETWSEIKDSFSETLKGFADIIGSPSDFSITKIIKKLMDSTDPNKEKEADKEQSDAIKNGGVSGEGAKSKSLLGTLNDLVYNILRALLAPVLGLVKGVRSIFGWITGSKTGDETIDSETKKASNNNSSDTKEEEEKGGFWAGVKKFFTGSGSGVHVTQKGSNKKFGKSTVDKNGCGPAVAASVLRTYGKDANLDDAANYAIANNYVAGSSGVGTRAGYFGDILGKNGIKTSYTDSKAQINKAVGSGSPTVLLGQDPNNTSKSNSPFGPNPHYVLARGTDSRGNILIDDPELDKPALYNKNILKNTKLGIMTGGDSGADVRMIERKMESDSDYIGKYVKKFESGDKGSSAISTGSGDHGGASFGSYQFPTNKSASDSLWRFWEKYYQSSYPNVTIGNNKAFKDAWLDAVKKDPAGFFKNEHDFMTANYYTPISNSLKANGVGDPTEYDRAAQEAAWSSATQYGPGLAASIFKSAGVSNSMDPKDYINKLYDYKYNNVDKNFKSSSKSMRDGIRKRFKEEKPLLLGIAGKAPISPGASGNPATANATSDTSTTTEETNSGFDLSSTLDTMLGNIFKNAASKVGGVAGSLISLIFGGDKNDNTTSTGSSNSGNVSTAGIDTENKMVETMSSILGKNQYSMDSNLREKVFDTIDNGAAKGYGDCSATVRKVIQRVSGINIGGNTEDQYLNYASRGGVVIEDTNGAGARKQGKIDGTNLRPGDALYYSRPDSSFSAGRKDRIGHVEMYMGGGKRAGHGSGMGPVISDVHDDEKRFLKAIRFVQDDSTTTNTTNSTTNANNSTGTGSGIPIYNFTDRRYIDRQYRNRVGGASNLGMSDQLAQKMIQLLALIAENTTYNKYLPEIIQALAALGNNIVSINRNSTPKSQDIQQNIDTNMARVISQIDAISQTL